MAGPAIFDADGSCTIVDAYDEGTIRWPAVRDWCSAWLTEWRTAQHGAASDFADFACDEAVDGVVDALVLLAELANNDDRMIDCIGAGPLEHLISHSGNGNRVVDEVEQAARRNVAFRNALGRVWLSDDVPTAVRERLALLGVRRIS